MSNSAEHSGYPWAGEAEGGFSLARLAVTNLTGPPDSDRLPSFASSFHTLSLGSQPDEYAR